MDLKRRRRRRRRSGKKKQKNPDKHDDNISREAFPWASVWDCY